MKKILYILLILILPFLLKAQNNGAITGEKHGGAQIRNFPTDAYNLGYADFYNGGYHTSPTKAGRDSLISYYPELLRQGMLDYVVATDTTYRYLSGSWVAIGPGNLLNGFIQNKYGVSTTQPNSGIKLSDSINTINAGSDTIASRKYARQFSGNATAADLSLYPYTKLQNFNTPEITPTALSSSTYEAFGGIGQFKTGKFYLVERQGTSHTSGGTIYLRTSSDGSNWTSPTAIATPASGFTLDMGAWGTLPSGRTVVFYFKLNTGSGQSVGVFYIYSDDNGATWSTENTLYSGQYYPYGKVVQIGSGRSIMTFYDISDNVYYATSDDNWTTFNAPQFLASGCNEATPVYLSGSTVMILSRISARTYFNQYISNDNGATWGYQGTTQFDLTTGNIAPWMETYMQPSGKMGVNLYYSHRVTPGYINVVSASADDLSQATGTGTGANAWNVSTVKSIAAVTDDGNSGYPSAVHPNNSAYSLVAFYLGTSSVTAINFTTYPQTGSLPLVKGSANYTDDYLINGVAVPSSIAGTTNQVNVSHTGSAYTLSLPQNINTIATPTFTNINFGTIAGVTSAPMIAVLSGSTSGNIQAITPTNLRSLISAAPASGSGSYIPNNVTGTPSAGYSFNIDGNGKVGGTMIADLYSAGGVTTTGSFAFKSAKNWGADAGSLRDYFSNGTAYWTANISTTFYGMGLNPTIDALNTANLTNTLAFGGGSFIPATQSGATGVITGSFGAYLGLSHLATGLTFTNYDNLIIDNPGGSGPITYLTGIKMSDQTRGTNNINFYVGSAASAIPAINANIYTVSSKFNYLGTGATLINTPTDNGTDKLIVNGSVSFNGVLNMGVNSILATSLAVTGSGGGGAYINYANSTSGGLSTPSASQVNEAFRSTSALTSAFYKTSTNLSTVTFKGNVSNTYNFPYVVSNTASILTTNDTSTVINKTISGASNTITNLPTTAIGTGTPGAGKYVDGGTGAWTLLPSSGISSVSNSDGTLTISPTSGAVVASLALGHANTWTAKQTIQLTTEQSRIGSDASNYISTTVASTGATTYSITGSAPTYSWGSGGSTYLSVSSNKVGISTASPFDAFANTSSNIVDAGGVGVSGTGSELWVINSAGYTSALYNLSTNSVANGLLVKIAGTASTNKAFNVNTASSQTTNGTDIFTILGNGTLKLGSAFQVTSSGVASGLTGITSSGTINFSGLTDGFVKSSSGVLSTTTAIPQVVGTANLVAQTGSITASTTAVGASNATFEIGTYLEITAITAASINVTITWTDQSGNSTSVNNLVNVSALGAYAGNNLTIRAKAGTNIVVSTTSVGTSETYNVGSKTILLP